MLLMVLQLVMVVVVPVVMRVRPPVAGSGSGCREGASCPRHPHLRPWPLSNQMLTPVATPAAAAADGEAEAALPAVGEGQVQRVVGGG